MSHRGYWLEHSEKNSDRAFRRSFELGFGTETDVRDCGGKIVIAHDIPNGNEMQLTDFARIIGKRPLPLAINVKADGLTLLLKQAMEDAGVADWFVFDMSIPDMRAYLQAGVSVFARMSEVERAPAWFDRVTGIWLDSFSDIWYDNNHILALLNNGKRVCIVSPELHGREYEPLWEMLTPLSSHPDLMLCTDVPERARKFFGTTQ